MSVDSQLNPYTSEVFLDCSCVHSFRDCIRQVVFSPNLVDEDYLLTDFVLQPQLSDFDVSNLSRPYAIAYSYRCTSVNFISIGPSNSIHNSDAIAFTPKLTLAALTSPKYSASPDESAITAWLVDQLLIK